MRSERNVFTVFWAEEEWDIVEPTIEELQKAQLWPRELTARRRAEIEAYLEQVRCHTSDSDRRFLKKLRIEAPESFAA